MFTSRTVACSTVSVLALLTVVGLAGSAGAADASVSTSAPASEPCGQPQDRVAAWPAELIPGTRLVSEVQTSYVVSTDCGVLTLVRSDDPNSSWYMTGYGLQRYPTTAVNSRANR
jgi:hypothetical protein